jgi:hypothetical protein
MNILSDVQQDAAAQYYKLFQFILVSEMYAYMYLHFVSEERPEISSHLGFSNACPC